MREFMEAARRRHLPPNLLLSDRDFTADDYEALCRLDEGVENRKGATRAEIESLPTERVAAPAATASVANASALQCAICLEDVEPGAVLRTLPCLHKFHKGCLDTWLAQQARCPICQASCKS